jgi:N-acyl-D-aspartate/D-glutamate deacylase
MGEFDLVIRGSTIVDGSGKGVYSGSIGVKGDRVAAVGEVEGDSARVVDAKGLTAVPGFIDSHSHADFMTLFFPRCESFLLQGVTTFVGGQCGMSLGPVGDMMPLPGAARIYVGELEPYKYYPSKTLFPRERVNALMEEKFGWAVDWNTMGGYMERVEEKGISCNYAPLVGHGAVRSLVMGEDYKRHTDSSERERMGEHIREAMGEGCIGMSVGLDYDPDVYASRDEFVEHAGIMKEYGAVFCPHSRRTGRRRNIAAGHRPHDKIDGLLEILDIIRKAEVKTNIAHLFTGWYVNPEGYPDILEEANRRATLQLIDDALEKGLDISFDVIPPALPMKFGGWQYLCGIFEPWLRELGSREAFGKWLKVRDFRDEVKDAIRRGKWWAARGIPNPNTAPRWADNITILKHKVPKNVDRTIADIAEERGVDQFETWLDLIAEDPDSKCGVSRGTDPEARYHSIFYQHPVSSVGLDTGVDDYKWEADVPPWSVPGINSYSAYVGFFDKFVNRQKVLTLEEAVYKTSTHVAERHNLKGRGVINEGGYADIVLMDLPKLKVMATPLETRIPPRGIEYVIVNGVPVVEKAKHTGATPGRVLRRE